MNIYPYKNGSQSAKDLAAALGVKQIKLEGSKFKGDKNKLIINWGSSKMSDEALKCQVLNNPEAVAIASDKLQFFKKIISYNSKVSSVNKVSIPRVVFDYNSAVEHFEAGFTVVCRTILNGHSGAGIVLMNPKDNVIQQIPRCQLYVMYQPKKSEYRVHVLNGEVVDIQKKVRRLETPDDKINWMIRNHENGFNYARDEVAENVPKSVLDNSLKAVAACGLDFGAVDVIYNERLNTCYVLEINTAPGLSGATLEGYRKRFEEIGKAWKDTPVKKKNELFLDGFDDVEVRRALNQAFEIRPVRHVR